MVFGITASAVFQCSNTVAEKYFRKETEAVQLSDGSAEQTGQTAAPSGEASTTSGSVAEVAESAMPEVVAITSVSIQEIPSFFGLTGSVLMDSRTVFAVEQRIRHYCRRKRG